MKLSSLALSALAAFALTIPSRSHADPVQGWLFWRGPLQHGISLEKNLPAELSLDGPKHLWTADLSGQSTPVIAGNRLYIMGYSGEGATLQELIACFDASTGERLWEHRFNDFLSDIIYTRYATSNPTVDPETGNVYMQGSQGIMAGFAPDGEKLWEHSMMELYGRMTFPNGRTASPVVDQDLVITHHITANWGANGPARDRFYAFDKHSGELVWTSTPGGQPKDSSYAPPTLAWWKGKRVIYCGTGDGAIVCFNGRTGDPIWRVKLSEGGINTDVLIHNDDKLITIHGSENIDTSEVGRMVAVRIPEEIPARDGKEPHVFDMKELELWRNDLSAFASSPILVGDRVYQVTETGDLCSVDANSGNVLWKEKLGIAQGKSSMVYADGRLYVPMLEDPEAKGGGTTGAHGAFYVVEPGDEGAKILTHLRLDGRCFGSPAIWDGRIYVQTTEKLYCFGEEGGSAETVQKEQWPEPGPAAQLQIVPEEVLLAPGEKVSFRVRTLDENGYLVEELEDVSRVQWRSYVPPTAKVKASLNGSFNEAGELVADETQEASAGAFEASLGDLKGYIRGRVLPRYPEEDFEDVELVEAHAVEKIPYAYPPLPWIGARFKFEVRDREGDQMLAKTIDNKLFQRAYVFIGHPEQKGYTVEADILTDGSRRKMSEVGLINQRYFIVLKGNSQQLEVNSNQERIKESVPFRVRPNLWYRMKTRVDVAEDGSGVVRAKVWPREEQEPEKWSIEVSHQIAHANGSPGLFGFSPQEMRVYIDDVKVTPNR